MLRYCVQRKWAETVLSVESRHQHPHLMKPPKVLLIHPPLVKPGEPPAGLAKLAGALHHYQIAFSVIDANIEGLRHLLKRHSGCPSTPSAREEPWENLSDTWTRRAKRHLEDHLQMIRCRQGYDNIDRYKRAVRDINRVLEKSVPAVRLSLCDYEDPDLSPVRSID